MTPDDTQRIDKWLWYARVVKSRTRAQKLAVSGRIRVNRNPIRSASRSIRIGDVLTISLDSGVRVLRIVSPGLQRRSAAEARLLYEDLSPQSASSATHAVAPPPRAGPPPKGHRRPEAACE